MSHLASIEIVSTPQLLGVLLTIACIVIKTESVNNCLNYEILLKITKIDKQSNKIVI